MLAKRQPDPHTSMNLLYIVPQEHLQAERENAPRRGSISSPIRRRPPAFKALHGRPMPEDGRVIDL